MQDSCSELAVQILRIITVGHVFDTDQEIISLLLMKVSNSRILLIII